MIRRLTLRDLDREFAGGERRWERLRPALRRLGLLSKVGRADFGDLEAIGRAVMDGSLEHEMTARASRPLLTVAR